MRGRADFAALTEAARAIGPTVTLGFADTWTMDGSASSIPTHTASARMSRRAPSNGTCSSEVSSEWWRTRAAELAMPGCFWIGFADAGPLTSAHRATFETIAGQAIASA
jgi:hypothetical protein